MLLLTWLLYPIIESVIQWYLIEKKKWKPIYLQLYILRGMVAILYGGIVLNYQLIGPWYKIAALFLFEATSFWLIFDPLLNFFRNKPFLYRGKESGVLDRMDYEWWLILKVLALVITPFLFVIFVVN